MPIDQSKKRTKGAVARSGIKKSGGKKTVIISVVIIAIILLSLFYLLSRRPSTVSEGPSEIVPKKTAHTDPGVTEGSQQGPGYVFNRAKLVLESVNNQNIIKVDIEKALGESGAEIVFKFDWSVNGKPAGDGTDTLRGAFKSGDKIAVKITPIDGEKIGQSKVLELTVQNTPPQVTDDKKPKYDGKTFSYQVKGSDTDGDTLSYSLEQAPQGMTINQQTGVINWQLQENDYGEHTIKVKVVDNKGGTTIYSVKVDLPKPSEAKKAPEVQK